MASSNYISKVAIVGAGGNSGRFMTDALLKNGKHTITALTRSDSSAKLPEGVIVKAVDYEKFQTLVDALRGQDALVITLSGHTPKETELQIINAAGEAGVPWILPNEWGPDTANEALVNDLFFFKNKVATRQAITDLGKSSYIAVCTGFWYEQSLAMPAGLGIDFANRAAVLYDDGETVVSTSTLAQLGRAVAALLSLPVKAQGSDAQTCLETYRDQVVYIDSFNVSQKDMLESALRVTGTKQEDWTISRESSHERFSTGMKEIKEGKHSSFPKIMSRVFFADGGGNFASGKATMNALLGLPEESLDEATKLAMEKAMG